MGAPGDRRPGDRMTRTILAALIGLAIAGDGGTVLARAADIEPTPQQMSVCLSDALRLCVRSRDNVSTLDRAGVLACMVAHKAQLSAACREAIR